MTIEQYRAFLVRNQKQIRYESDEDDAAMEYYGDIQSVIDAIDQGKDVEAAAKWVGVDYLVGVRV